MNLTRATLCAAFLLSAVAPAFAATLMTDTEKHAICSSL